MTTFIPFGGPPTRLDQVKQSGLNRALPVLASREGRNLMKRSLQMQIQLSNLGQTQPVYSRVYKARFGQSRGGSQPTYEHQPAQRILETGLQSQGSSKYGPYSAPIKCMYDRWAETPEDRSSDNPVGSASGADPQQRCAANNSIGLTVGVTQNRLALPSVTGKEDEYIKQMPIDGAPPDNDLKMTVHVDEEKTYKEIMDNNIELIRVDGSFIREISQIKERHKNLEELTKLKQKEAMIQQAFLGAGKPKTAPGSMEGERLQAQQKATLEQLARQRRLDSIKEKTTPVLNRNFKLPYSSESSGLSWHANPVVAHGQDKPVRSKTSPCRTIHPAADAAKANNLHYAPLQPGHTALVLLPRKVTDTTIPIEAAQRLHSILKTRPQRLHNTPIPHRPKKADAPWLTKPVRPRKGGFSSRPPFF